MTDSTQSTQSDRERKKGTADMLVLSLLAEHDRHGYEVAKLIEQRSGGRLVFHVASLYSLLYRLEKRGWIRGRWVEKPGERRRRFYGLTKQGQTVLGLERERWREFVEGVRLVTEWQST